MSYVSLVLALLYIDWSSVALFVLTVIKWFALLSLASSMLYIAMMSVPLLQEEFAIWRKARAEKKIATTKAKIRKMKENEAWAGFFFATFGDPQFDKDGNLIGRHRLSAEKVKVTKR